ncbi:MAG: MBL fold metallo-hydrolase [Candidatus Hydrogenedentes bacterium]|nr:MBL fold metallo-hydrolase [Candidatus Hydrogenedentota bacterium]
MRPLIRGVISCRGIGLVLYSGLADFAGATRQIARNIEEGRRVLRFSLLGSGSSGNALFIAGPSSKILIDDGLSLRQVHARLAEIGESLDGLRAVFVTHEHNDHVTGIGPLARKCNVPVFVTQRTYERFPQAVGPLPHVHFFESGDAVDVDGMTLTSFNVSHDAVDPIGFAVECDGVKLGVASDLGHVSSLVRMRLKGSNGLILESNYCPRMLLAGSYPPVLQQRIRGRTGHLSNPDCNSLLASLLHDRLRVVVLAHLSDENNRVELALSLAAGVLGDHPAQLHVAHRHRPTPMFELTA